MQLIRFITILYIFQMNLDKDISPEEKAEIMKIVQDIEERFPEAEQTELYNSLDKIEIGHHDGNGESVSFYGYSVVLPQREYSIDNRGVLVGMVSDDLNIILEKPTEINMRKEFYDSEQEDFVEKLDSYDNTILDSAFTFRKFVLTTTIDDLRKSVNLEEAEVFAQTLILKSVSLMFSNAFYEFNDGNIKGYILQGKSGYSIEFYEMDNNNTPHVINLFDKTNTLSIEDIISAVESISFE